ncbi:MAG: hypothetical protein M4579_007486, partial [Chaenotheca gracillima]
STTPSNLPPGPERNTQGEKSITNPKHPHGNIYTADDDDPEYREPTDSEQDDKNQEVGNKDVEIDKSEYGDNTNDPDIENIEEDQWVLDDPLDNDSVPGLSVEELDSMFSDAGVATVISHHQVGLWADACKFFKHDATRVRLEDTLTISGMKVGLRPSQLLAVYWMITQPLRVDIYGGFLADGMGLGKTIESVTLWVVNCWLHKMYNDVRSDRLAHLSSPTPKAQALHLPRTINRPDEDSSQAEDAVCPSNGQGFPFQCICEEHGLTYAIFNKFCRRGPTLAVVLPALVQQWYSEVTKGIQVENQ